MVPYAISIKYMIAGYIAIFVIFATYLLSLFARWRRLKHDMQMLKNLEKEQ